MKKKIISIILAIVFLFTITSCVNKKEYTATFNANGGKVNGSEYYEIKFKENAGLLEFPVATRAGYRFVGWYLDGELITAIDKTANTDVELKAEWEEYTFTTPVTDRVKLTADYEGKDYYEDGIGSDGEGGYYATAWVIQNGNMDYLKCADELSWSGQTSCK